MGATGLMKDALPIVPFHDSDILRLRLAPAAGTGSV